MPALRADSCARVAGRPGDRVEEEVCLLVLFGSRTAWVVTVVPTCFQVAAVRRALFAPGPRDDGKRVFNCGQYVEICVLCRRVGTLVFHVLEARTGRHAALKLSRELVTARSGAELVALNHPNVVRHYGSFLQHTPLDGPAFGIAMELMDFSLDKMFGIRGAAGDVGTVKHIALCVARGLAYLHGLPNPIYHGDLKAEHVGDST